MEERVEEEGQVEGGLDTDRDDDVSEEEGEDLMEVRTCVLRECVALWVGCWDGNGVGDGDGGMHAGPGPLTCEYERTGPPRSIR